MVLLLLLMMLVCVAVDYRRRCTAIHASHSHTILGVRRLIGRRQMCVSIMRWIVLNGDVFVILYFDFHRRRAVDAASK